MTLPPFERQVKILLNYYFEGWDMELVHSESGDQRYVDHYGTVWRFTSDADGAVTFDTFTEKKLGEC